MLLLITIVTSGSAVVTFRPIGSSYNTLKIRYIRDYVDAHCKRLFALDRKSGLQHRERMLLLIRR